VPWDPIDDAIADLEREEPVKAKSTRTDNGHSNGRGPAWRRRQRKQKLVDVHGDGTYVACWNVAVCGRAKLTVETVTADRIVMGVDGGTYRFDNLRPSCLNCNTTDGQKRGHQRQGSEDDFRRDAR
jgi:hypothetical protein